MRIPFLSQDEGKRPKRTIVAGYDGTEPSERALYRTSELAKRLDAKVVVTSVTPLMVGGPRSAGPVDPTDSPARHRELLRSARSALERRGVEAQTVPAIGDPGQMIATVADRKHADLIVVGGRRLGAFRRLFAHSVSRRVARRAHCDVLVVH